MSNAIFLYLSNMIVPNKTTIKKTSNLEVTSSISMIYHLRDENSLFLLKDGSVWRTQGDEETPFHWEEGDPLVLLNPTSQWTDRIDIENLNQGDYTDLQRFGKSTLKSRKIQGISNIKEGKQLILEGLGAWNLFFDESNQKMRRTLNKWLPYEEVILIVDPGKDWNAYPDKKGEYDLSWEFHFLNIDREELISPPAYFLT